VLSKYHVRVVRFKDTTDRTPNFRCLLHDSGIRSDKHGSEVARIDVLISIEFQNRKAVGNLMFPYLLLSGSLTPRETLAP
jgi:hypothetical protein